MKKIVKWIAIVVGMVVLLAILLVVSLATFVNPNRFKPLIAEKIQSITGRQLIIDGDLSWTIFPTFGVKTDHIVLKNPAGYDQAIFAEVKHVTLSVRLMPLWHQKIESSGISLDGMKLHLIKNSQGQANWDFQEENAKTSSTITSSAGHAKPSLLAVAISGLTISNSEISWTDEQTKQFISLEKFNLYAKDFNLLKPFPVSSKFILINPTQALKSEVQINTHVSLNRDAEVFSFRNVEVVTHTEQNKQSIHATFAGDVMADLAKQTLQWENFHARSNDLNVTGKISVANLMTNPVTTGHLQIASFDLRKWLQASGQDVATLQGLKNVEGEFDLIPAPKSLAINGRLVVDEVVTHHIKVTNLKIPIRYSQGIVTLAPISASFYQGKLEGSVSVDLNTALPRFTIFANLNRFNVATLLQDLSPKQKLTLAGNANMDIKATTLVGDKKTLLKNLDGSGHINSDNGVLQGIDIHYLISNATAKLTKKDTLASNTKQTKFNALNASFVIQAGVVSNTDLVMSSTDFMTKGQGTVNLIHQTMDYHVKTELNQIALSNNQQFNLHGLAIPVRIVGSLQDPQIGLDTEALTKFIAEQQVQKVKAQLQERIEKGKITEKAGKFLQNLLGR